MGRGKMLWSREGRKQGKGAEGERAGMEGACKVRNEGSDDVMIRVKREERVKKLFLNCVFEHFDLATLIVIEPNDQVSIRRADIYYFFAFFFRLG